MKEIVTFSGKITIHGRQGHVAYPEHAQNPLWIVENVIHKLKDLFHKFKSHHFDASHLELVSIDTNNPTFNIIPEKVTISFNVRFNPYFTIESLTTFLQKQLFEISDHYQAYQFLLECFPGSSPFYAPPGPWHEKIQNLTHGQWSTGGGTSDGRFLKDLGPVLELGLCHETAHQINEKVPLNDIETLCTIYQKIWELF